MGSGVSDALRRAREIHKKERDILGWPSVDCEMFMDDTYAALLDVVEAAQEAVMWRFPSGLAGLEEALAAFEQKVMEQE